MGTLRPLCSVLNVIRTHPERDAFGKFVDLVRRLAEKFGVTVVIEVNWRPVVPEET